jgi:hypothetical protein
LQKKQPDTSEDGTKTTRRDVKNEERNGLTLT